MSDLADVEVNGSNLADAIAARDLLDAKITVAVGVFDASGEWELDGAVSCTQWLRANAGMRGAEAGAIVKRARKLRSLATFAEAWLDGSLTKAHIDAVLTNVSGDTIDLLVRDEAELVPLLVPLSPEDAALVMRQWREHVRDDTLRDEKPSEVRVSAMLDGRHVIDGHLAADDAVIVTTALELARTDDADGETRTAAQRTADAFVDIHRFFLDHHQSADTSKRRRPHVNVIVDIDDLDHSETIDGRPLTPAATKTLLCDAGYHRVVTQGRSSILDYGTTQYLVPMALFTALVLRDRRCRHPGCDRPPQWCHAHHVIPFPNGPTALSNLVLKCSRHHQLGHKPGWSETLEPDGTLQITAPDGRTWTTTPPGALPRTFGLAA